LSNGLPSFFLTNDLFTDGNNLYAATDVGIFMSSDTGVSWSILNNTSSYYFTCVYANGSDIFASTDAMGEIMYSNDNGNSWTIFTSGLPNTFMTSFFIDGTKAYTGSYGSGIYVNTNLINYRSDQFKNEISLEISPNPTTGDFKLSWNLLNNSSTLEIINMTGQIIYSRKLNSGSTGLEHLHLNAPDGTYIVKMIDNKSGLIGKSRLNILSAEK
jgi:hypothetical protein